MFELFIEIIVTVAVLAFFGGGNKPATATAVELEDPEIEAAIALADELIAALEPKVTAAAVVLEVFTADERITTAVTRDYAAMSIAELKALGKQHNIPGWKAWKKPQTAIAKLEALAA